MLVMKDRLLFLYYTFRLFPMYHFVSKSFVEFRLISGWLLTDILDSLRISFVLARNLLCFSYILGYTSI